MRRDDVEGGQTWIVRDQWCEVLEVLDVQVHVRWLGSEGPAYLRIATLTQRGELVP